MVYTLVGMLVGCAGGCVSGLSSGSMGVFWICYHKFDIQGDHDVCHLIANDLIGLGRPFLSFQSLISCLFFCSFLELYCYSKLSAHNHST